jgi:hypothetical protein
MSREPQKRPQTSTDEEVADKNFGARPFRERAGTAEAAAEAAQQTHRGSAPRWSQLLLGRRSPTLPDLELNSMLQSYLDETSHSCQHQQQQQQQQQQHQNGFPKFSDDRCQQNFPVLRKRSKNNSSDTGLSDDDDDESFERKSKMHFLPFESQLSTQTVGFSSRPHHQAFQTYCHDQVSMLYNLLRP